MKARLLKKNNKMTKISVKVEQEIIVEFDEHSEDFKALWAGYKEHFDSDADFESFAESIASMIARYGTQEMIEGVGFVKLNGENQRIYHNGEYKEQNGIINIEVETDLNRMVDFDVEATRLHDE